MPICEEDNMSSVTVANISFPFVEEDRHVKFLPHKALSLTAALEARGYHVDFRDYQQVADDYDDPQDPANVTSFFEGAEEIVIVVTPHDAMPLAILWAERLNTLEPDHTIVFGGYGPIHVASLIAERFPFVNVAIHGTLETVGPQLVDNIGENWDKVAGIAYRHNKRVFVTPPSSPISNLDQLPLPAYNKVNLNSYQENLVYSTKGCPYRCIFCVRGGKLIEKSIDNLIHEISILRKVYGQKRVFFYDQTFTLRRQRVFDFCRRLREAGLTDVEWSCTGRINIAEVEVMREMANSGCKMIYFGVESGSDHVLKRINKRITREQAERVIDEARKFFYVNTFFIWGFPFESMDDFKETLEMIQQLADVGVASILYVLSPLPSSRLHDEYSNKLSFCREVWESNWPAHLVNRKSRSEIAKLIKAHPMVFPGFYTCDPLILEKLHIIREAGLETHYPDV